MSITSPSPNVLVNGSSTANGINIGVSDTTTTFQLEDPAGVNVWVLECIGADEINTEFLTAINNNLTYTNATTRTLQNATLRAQHADAIPTGTALIFRSTVNGGVDINGNLRDDFVTTFGVYILTVDGFNIYQGFRVGATNETIEGDEETGWTSKLNEIIRTFDDPPIASTSTPGLIKLAQDLGGTGLLPRVVKINGVSIPQDPGAIANQVLQGTGSNAATWGLIEDDNISSSAAIQVSKLQVSALGSGFTDFLIGTNGNPHYVTLIGDISVSDTSSTEATVTTIGIRGKDLASSLSSIGPSQDGYVLTWNDPFQYWEAKPQTGGGGGGSVSWANDLNGSTDTNQYVVELSGFNSRSQVTLGTTGEFVLGGKNLANASLSNTTLAAQNGTSAGTGSDLLLRAGSGPQNAFGDSGGHLIFRAGRGGGAADNGTIYFQHQPPFPSTSSTTFAEFAYSHVDIDPTATSSTSYVIINSGTGGTALDSTGDIAISAADTVTINGDNGFFLKDTNNTLISSAGTGTGPVRIWSTIDLHNTTNGTSGIYVGGSSTSGTATSISLAAQTANPGNGGHVYITSGGVVTGSGYDGYIHFQTGGNGVGVTGDEQMVIRPWNIEFNPSIILNDLAGNGAGYVAVDNSGTLSFVSGATPSGSAGGDLSGTYPNPTVAKINGTSVPATPNANEVLVATSGTVSDWAKIVDANVDATAAIAYSKLNLSNSIVNADINSSAAIAYNKLNLSGSIVNADVSNSAAIAVSKLAAGTGGQFLINNTTPTPTWVSLSADVELANTSGTMRVNSFGHGQSNATAFPVSAGSTSDVMYISGAGQLSFGKVDLASAMVTGVLPTGNQANQAMGGDISGTTNSATVDKIKNRTVNDTDPNDGDVLTWDEANNYWEYLPPPTGNTWANDLAGSTNTNQYVAAISGNAGGGGTVALNITTLQYALGQTSPTIKQADQTAASTAGQDLTIQAQNGTGTTSDGGHLVLTSGTGTSSAGYVKIQAGGSDRAVFYSNGNVQFFGGSGVDYGTGIIHSDSTGNLSSSLIVNADVDASAAIAYSKLNLSGGIVNADVNASAAIAVSKLATGTAGQLLLNNSTPTPTWTTVSGDATISATGAVEVVAIRNNAVKSEALGAGQDSYVLTWVDANSRWEAQPAPGAGSGVTTVGTIDSQTKSANGAVISGVNIYMQTADATNPGLVSTGTQTMAGAKTWSGAAVFSSTVQTGALTAGTTTTNNTLTGGVIWTTRSISGNLTIDTTTKDMIILVDTSSARTITLPAPANGRTFIIKDKTGQAETNNITLARNASEQIEGVAASRTLSTNWGVWTITSDGTNWFFI